MMTKKFVYIKLMFPIAVTGTAIFVATAVAPGLVWAASDSEMTTITHDSETMKALKMEEPSYERREERLKAKPLDWKATSGKPKPRTLTAPEMRALRKAKPKSAEGGEPNPKADAEARARHPDDWK